MRPSRSKIELRHKLKILMMYMKKRTIIIVAITMDGLVFDAYIWWRCLQSFVATKKLTSCFLTGYKYKS